MTTTTPHQAIYRRWRAQTFGQIVGQEAVVATLRNAVRAGRVAHAVLFVGPRGTGKTSLARILAKALNCNDLRDGDPCDACESCVAIREGTTLDVVEIDAASNRGINEVRDLRERLQYAPTSLRRKVYILDEAHQITRDAWNALLKSLEEPPDFVVFMFASTHPQEFPPAILSRLQRYDVRRLTPAEIEGKLARILEADGRTAEPEALRLIARLAAGGMRDAESMLDQLLSSVDAPIDEASVRALLGLAERESIERFVVALEGRDAAAGIAVLEDLEDRGRDLRTFLDQVVEAIRAALVADLGSAGRGTGSGAGLVSAARRLAAIDPGRAGAAGLRLQLELALFADGSASEVDRPRPEAPRRPVRADPGAAPAGPTSGPLAEPTPVAVDPAGSIPPPAAPQVAPADLEPPRSRQAPAVIPPPAPAPPPAARPAADVTTAGQASIPPSAELDRLRELWPEVVAHISAHPPTRPLIVACRPISIEGRVVTLGFPEDQAFLKDVAVRRRSNLETGIAQFLGHEVTVHCVATNLDTAAFGSGDGDADLLLAEARRIFADDLVETGEVE